MYGRGSRADRGQSVHDNKVPLLVAVGTKDELVAKPEDVAIMIPNAKLLKLGMLCRPVRSGDRDPYHQAVLKFFESAPK